MFQIECTLRGIALHKTRKNEISGKETIDEMIKMLVSYNSAKNPSTLYDLPRMATIDDETPDTSFSMVKRQVKMIPETNKPGGMKLVAVTTGDLRLVAEDAEMCDVSDI